MVPLLNKKIAFFHDLSKLQLPIAEITAFSYINEDG